MPMSPEAAALDAIFDGAAAIEPLRDKPWGRPLLVPTPQLAADPLVTNPKNRKPRTDGRLPYTRASSLSNYVTDHSALETWRMRSLTYGLAQREDLAAMAAALPPIHSNLKSKEALSKQERISDDLTNKRLDEIAEEAMIFANRDYKANWGTAVHSFTDPGPSGVVPARMAADVASWHAATRGWVFHGTEMFTANDRLQSAGTFDHLCSIPWLPELGAMIVDKKTGILHLDQFAIQGYSYASGQPYNLETDEREEWPVQPSLKWAILAHIPAGLGRTNMYLVDLEKGKGMALTAVAVRADRSLEGLGELRDFQQEGRDHVAGLLSMADHRMTMEAIAAQYVDLWDDSLRAVARQRLAELEAAA